MEEKFTTLIFMPIIVGVILLLIEHFLFPQFRTIGEKDSSQSMRLFPLRRLLSFFVVFWLGLFFGTFIFGWMLFPSQPTNIEPSILREDIKDYYIKSISIVYKNDVNHRENIIRALNEWSSPRTIFCDVANRNSFDRTSVDNILLIVNELDPIGCDDYFYTTNKGNSNNPVVNVFLITFIGSLVFTIIATFLVNKYFNQIKIGMVIGLVLLGLLVGFYIARVPLSVEWVDAPPAQLSEPYKRQFVQFLADRYVIDNDIIVLRLLESEFEKPNQVVCVYASTTIDPLRKQNLISLSTNLNGYGCE